MPLPWIGTPRRRDAEEGVTAVDKDIVQHRLGGTPALAAKWLRIPQEVFDEWPPVLNDLMVDRALAAIMKCEIAKATRQSVRQWHEDPRNKLLVESLVERVSLCAIAAHLMEPAPIDLLRAEQKEPRRKRMPRTQRGFGTAGTDTTPAAAG